MFLILLMISSHLSQQIQYSEDHSALGAKVFSFRCRGVIPTFAPRTNVRPEGGFAFPGDDKSELRLPFYPYTYHDGEPPSTDTKEGDEMNNPLS